MVALGRALAGLASSTCLVDVRGECTTDAFFGVGEFLRRLIGIADLTIIVGIFGSFGEAIAADLTGAATDVVVALSITVAAVDGRYIESGPASADLGGVNGTAIEASDGADFVIGGVGIVEFGTSTLVSVELGFIDREPALVGGFTAEFVEGATINGLFSASSGACELTAIDLMMVAEFQIALGLTFDDISVVPIRWGRIAVTGVEIVPGVAISSVLRL